MSGLAIQSGRAIADTAEARESWLAERRNGIGASEAAAVLGLSRWETPLEVYLRKKGLMPPKEETAAMRRGRRMEAVIAEEYQEATGHLIIGTQLFVHHPERPWQFATLDAVSSDFVPVELKSVGWRSAHEWGDPDDVADAIPEHYLVQVMHQLAVTGAPLAHVAALIGGSEFRLYEVERNEDVIASITEKEREFMRRLEEDDPPPASQPADAGLMKWLYPEASGFVILGPEESRVASGYREIGATVKTLEEQRAIYRARLLEAMGNAAEAELTDGTRVTRKIVEVKEQQIARKAYSFVDLRFKAPREALG